MECLLMTSSELIAMLIHDVIDVIDVNFITLQINELSQQKEVTVIRCPYTTVVPRVNKISRKELIQHRLTRDLAREPG